METGPKKTNWWGIGGVIGLGIFLVSSLISEPEKAPIRQINTPSVVETKVAKPIDLSAFQQRIDSQKGVGTSPDVTDSSDDLSNDNYYTNVDGNSVHAPAYSLDGDVPAGATARCRDGTYSFSQNRRGTCSHHGGVASWL